MEIISEIRTKLFSMQDAVYRDFQAKLMPTVPYDTVIGVRTPTLRAYAKELAKDPRSELFLSALPHKYYEENNLHAFLIEKIKDYDKCVCAVDDFLPHVDNWATCDMMRPKIFDKFPYKLKEQAKKWIASDKTYTIRYGIGMLMNLLSTDAFSCEHSDIIANIRSEEYYVNMMTAWYFATALAFHYDMILPYIENRRLDKFTHNKAIQKALESYRITPEQKACLRMHKIM